MRRIVALFTLAVAMSACNLNELQSPDASFPSFDAGLPGGGQDAGRDGTGDGDAGLGPASSATVGMAGGTVQHPGGTMLLVPPGALATSQTLSVQTIPVPAVASAEGAAVGEALLLGPEGTRFAEPVQLVVPYDPSRLPEGAVEAALVVMIASQGAAELTALPTVVDTVQHKLYATTSHFSIVWPWAPLNRKPIFVTTRSPLPPGKVDQAYRATLSALGGTPPLQFSLAPASRPLPPGLAIAASGELAGTPKPTAAGTWSFTLRVTDSSAPNPQRLERIFALAIGDVPVLDAIYPPSVLAGAGVTTLALHGSGFNSGSVVVFDGANLATTFLSADLLNASIPAELLSTAKLHTIRVRNSSGASTSAQFTVDNPLPHVALLDPATTLLTEAAVQLSLSGEGFVEGSVAVIGRQALNTVFVAADELMVEVPASFVASLGIVNIGVYNPPPGGGLGNSVPFRVVEPWDAGEPSADAGVADAGSAGADARPEVIAGQQGAATLIATHLGRVFWIDAGGYLWMLEPWKTQPTQLSGNYYGARDLLVAADGAYVTWGDRLTHVDPDTGARVDLAQGQVTPGPLAGRPPFLHWANADGTIMSLGSTQVPSVVASLGPTAPAHTVSGLYGPLYVSRPAAGRIDRIDLTTRAVSPLYEDESAPTLLAAWESQIFWWNSASGELKLGDASGQTPRVVASTAWLVTAVASDADGLYYSSDYDGTIWMLSHDLQKRVALARPGEVRDFAVDPQYVYWIDVQTKSIRRAPKALPPPQQPDAGYGDGSVVTSDAGGWDGGYASADGGGEFFDASYWDDAGQPDAADLDGAIIVHDGGPSFDAGPASDGGGGWDGSAPDGALFDAGTLAPEVRRLTPGFVSATGSATWVSLSGARFTEQTYVGAYLTGSGMSFSCDTAFVSSTELKAQLPALMMSMPGRYILNAIDVITGVSNPISFNIYAAVDAGGVPDAASPEDAGAFDAGMTADAGTKTDAGAAFDAGGMPDAGFPSDAGAFDAGATADAGTTTDAGAIMDAGLGQDAGPGVDAGTSIDAGTTPFDGGLADAGHALDAGSYSDAGSDVDAGPPPPGIESSWPAQLVQGSGVVQVSIFGSNFVQGSHVEVYAGASFPLPTEFVSSRELTVMFPTDGGSGMVPLRVCNPSAAGMPARCSAVFQLSVAPEGTDAGPDGGKPQFDAGESFDAGERLDAGSSTLDAGFVGDAGQPVFDGGYPAFDGGVMVDAGAPDSGGTDGGFVHDGGASYDGGIGDGGDYDGGFALVPTIQWMEPNWAYQNAGDTHIAIFGTNLDPSCAVTAGIGTMTTRLTSTFDPASSQLLVIVTADLLKTAGEFPIVVSNADGASNPAWFSVRAPELGNPVPVITGLSPKECHAGSDSLLLEIWAEQGTINDQTEVWAGSTKLEVASRSANLIRVVMPGFLLAGATTLQVSLVNPAPGGGMSAQLPFDVVATGNAVPILTTVSLAEIPRGSPSVTFVVAGSGFSTSAQVVLDGVALPATFQSSSALTVTASPWVLSAAGVFELRVINPVPGGGASFPVPFVVSGENPVPVIERLSPATLGAGTGDFFVMVLGRDFTRASIVEAVRDGQRTPAAPCSDGSCGLMIPAAMLAMSGVVTLEVTTPMPGGGVSSFELVVQPGAPTPQLGGLEPTSVVAGSAGETIVLRGSGFVPNSIVKLFPEALTLGTEYVSSTELLVTLPAELIAQERHLVLGVDNPAPGGGLSGTVMLQVVALPVLDSITPSVVPMGAGFRMTLVGRDFGGGTLVATVSIGGVKLTAIQDPAVATQLFVDVPDFIAAKPGDYPVLVSVEGKGDSNALSLSVLAP